MTDIGTDVVVTIRYFAAARAAAGTAEEIVTLPLGVTVAGALKYLGAQHPDLIRVLERCSYLRDGIAVRDLEFELDSGQTLDVLPPFAGG